MARTARDASAADSGAPHRGDPSDHDGAGFSLAIVGRPNVGKSTLFNRLVGKRLALVDDQPGVTRDLREGAARLGPLRFTAIDTAGLEDVGGDALPARMRRLTERAIAEADLCLFVLDARQGVTPTDEIVADLLRKRGVRVLLAANKSEGRAGEAGLAEAYGLGLGDPIPISAEHGEGMEDLFRALQDAADVMTAEFERAAIVARREASTSDGALSKSAGAAPDGASPDRDVPETDLEPEHPGDPSRPLQIAVVGRPNAGKSTLVNRLLGDDRLLTGPEAGITRDAIGFELEWLGRRFKVFDTAGLRKKARVQAKLEKLSVGDALRAVRFAEVVVLLMDADGPFETQDLRIADLAEREGRAVVFGVNKWDLETDKQKALADLKEKAERLLPQLRGAPLVTLSAETGRGLDRLHAAILAQHAAWNRRVPTARLNRWLMAMSERHPPPAPGGRRIRLRYMTQAKTRPPTFALFVSRPAELPEDYKRFLVNRIRVDFEIPGAPIRIIVKGADNPFADTKKKRA